jgi:transcriptional regulator with XRE-family HTH domain
VRFHSVTGKSYYNLPLHLAMNLHQQILSARNKKGLTQEELANLTNVTARTIQRIESGESTPRKFTLKVLASALDLPFEDLLSTGDSAKAPSIKDQEHAYDDEDVYYFLRLLCLSCFTYVLIPYIHFLIPLHLLKKRKEQNVKVLRFARNAIQSQIYWVVFTNVIFLLTLGYNFMQAAYFNKQYTVSYVVIFLITYLFNAIVILKNFINIKTALQ